MIRTALSNHLRQVRKDEGGFTLIELLIVIVILGILAGIVVFGVGTFRQRRRRRVQGRLQDRVEVAAEAYNAKTGGYPASIGDPGHRRRTSRPRPTLASATTVIDADGAVHRLAADR